MRKYLNAKKLTVIGKRCTGAYRILRMMTLVHVAIAGALMGSLLFTDELLRAIPFFLILPVVLPFLFMGKKLLYKKRTFNNYTYTPELYALIVDELRLRKMPNMHQFIEDNEAHTAQTKIFRNHLCERCYSGLNMDEKINAVVALLYSTDMEPKKTQEAIVSIIKERDVSDPDELRSLVQEYAKSEMPLMAGVL